MSNLEAKYIGNGLYQVFVDDKKYGVPCELDRLGMIYDDMLAEENCKEVVANG